MSHSYSPRGFFISAQKECLLERESGSQKENELKIPRALHCSDLQQDKRQGSTRKPSTQTAKPKACCYREKGTMSDFNIHTFQTTVFQALPLQPSLLVGARSRGKFPESKFWQRLPLTLQRIQFSFFFFKNIFIPFCHKISWTMFIFPLQVIQYVDFSYSDERNRHISFFPYKILPACGWGQSLRLYFRESFFLCYHEMISILCTSKYLKDKMRY